MKVVPWWALVSSAIAPVVLIGGWVLAASLQPAVYDPMTASISALAGNGAVDSWLMTSAFYVLGVCHMFTALGLRTAAQPGRVVLACGGLTSIVVGLSPEPSDGTSSVRHLVATGIGFTLLALFPVLCAVRDDTAPWALRPATGGVVTVLMALGAAWFLVELHGHGVAGLVERILTGAQTIWPFVLVATCVVVQAQAGAAARRRAPFGAAAEQSRSDSGPY